MKRSEALGLDTAEKRLSKSIAIVEATANEVHCLWREWARESKDSSSGRLSWKDSLGGWVATVGELDKRPVCIELRFDLIDSQMVCFWSACSEVVDHRMIKTWLDKRFAGRSVDAKNFHNAVHEINKANEWSVAVLLKDGVFQESRTFKSLDDAMGFIAREIDENKSFTLNHGTNSFDLTVLGRCEK